MTPADGPFRSPGTAPETADVPAASVDRNSAAFPEQYARTRRFSLGVPRQFGVSPDGRRVLFVRTGGSSDPVGRLWVYEGGVERVLIDPVALGADPAAETAKITEAAESTQAGEGRLPEAERVRRERAREFSTGVVAYAADAAARVVACALSGALWVVRTDGGAPVHVPAAGPAVGPRPSPDGRLVAYVTGGSLHVVALEDGKDRQLAAPEGPDVTYGLPEYVAAESMGRSRGYWWAPDSRHLLVARVDTSGVERRYISDPAHPERPPRAVAYPAAGTANAEVSLHILPVAASRAVAPSGAVAASRAVAPTGTVAASRAVAPTGTVAASRAVAASGTVAASRAVAPSGSAADAGERRVDVAWDRAAYTYLVSAGWDNHGPLIGVQTRDQRTLRTLAVDPGTGATRTLHERTDPAWTEIVPGTPARTASGALVLPEDTPGTRHLNVGGTTVTPPGLQVREVVAVEGERVWFTGGEEPTAVHAWRWAPADGLTRLSDGPGLFTAAAGGGTVVISGLTPEGPVAEVRSAGPDRPVTRVRGSGPDTADGPAGTVRTIGTIASLGEDPVVTPRPEHLLLGRRELRAALYLPSWYEPGTGTLPVLLSPYGGPGIQLAVRARTWFACVAQWFAEEGFAVLVADGRGTPGRGPAWEKAVHGDQLTPALEDQTDALHAAAARFADLDLSRVAIRGWSFGGFLAAAAVLHRPDVFHAAVAGAAPTDQRLYDTHWKERFLGHPRETPDHYTRSSLVGHGHLLRRPLLLVQGLADDNVAPAHTLRFSAELLAAGRPHSVLPLPGAGHAPTDPAVNANLLRFERDFLRSALDKN
ncbi:S9 family peptidase [Streptomyces paromomycinus]|uniref:Xaa-Pro dipeptidase n=1 Tax=Streptomyces paromomycinus TaxID=92743 RepID=A0A401WE14_STREY|nr:prolyl oligopeptidase family serine peptidase [Streptomyces paromomycinus]GCD47542.1 Xaa-Pro dipeptidase [Streptomyces paromomycinus]